jgi:NTP pyrophosphatase (non-canonical NTP hydrolase)
LLLEKYAKENLHLRPRTLDGYVDMFGYIYGGHNEAAHMGEVFLHLTEELGEVARWIHLLKKGGPDMQRRVVHGEMASELADVFSWISKLVVRANSEYRGFREYMEHFVRDGAPEIPNEIRLSELIGSVYGSGCPECREAHCSAACPGWTGAETGESMS